MELGDGLFGVSSVVELGLVDLSISLHLNKGSSELTKPIRSPDEKALIPPICSRLFYICQFDNVQETRQLALMASLAGMDLPPITSRMILAVELSIKHLTSSTGLDLIAYLSAKTAETAELELTKSTSALLTGVQRMETGWLLHGE